MINAEVKTYTDTGHTNNRIEFDTLEGMFRFVEDDTETKIADYDFGGEPIEVHGHEIVLQLNVKELVRATIEWRRKQRGDHASARISREVLGAKGDAIVSRYWARQGKEEFVVHEGTDTLRIKVKDDVQREIAKFIVQRAKINMRDANRYE